MTKLALLCAVLLLAGCASEQNLQPTPPPPSAGQIRGIDMATDASDVAGELQGRHWVDFVARYYRDPASRWPALSASEAQRLSALGVKIVTVWEWHSGNPDYFTYASGYSDALSAYRQARSIGQPPGSAIYFAVDFNARGPAIYGIDQYFRGVNAGLAAAGGGRSPYRVGVYGSGSVCAAVKAAGLAQYAWLSGSASWDGTAGYTGWNIKQAPAGARFANLSFDHDANEAAGDYGGFRLAGYGEPATPGSTAIAVASAAPVAAASVVNSVVAAAAPPAAAATPAPQPATAAAPPMTTVAQVAVMTPPVPAAAPPASAPPAVAAAPPPVAAPPGPERATAAAPPSTAIAQVAVMAPLPVPAAPPPASASPAVAAAPPPAAAPTTAAALRPPGALPPDAEPPHTAAVAPRSLAAVSSAALEAASLAAAVAAPRPAAAAEPHDAARPERRTARLGSSPARTGAHAGKALAAPERRGYASASNNRAADGLARNSGGATHHGEFHQRGRQLSEPRRAQDHGSHLQAGRAGAVPVLHRSARGSVEQRGPERPHGSRRIPG